jgi:transposase-like protein
MSMKKRGRKPKCPYCRSGRTVSKGARRTVTLGDRPLRVCRDCGRKFTVQRVAKPQV